MNITFDTKIDRFNTNCKLWDSAQNQYDKPMGISDLDFSFPFEMTEAIKNRAEHSYFGHTYPANSLYGTIIRYMNRLYHWKIDKDKINYV